MIEFLLIPPVAFLLYVVLVSILSGIGRVMSGTHHSTSTLKSSAYASGEAPHHSSGAPGYRPFFQVALFFAVLHLTALVLATGRLSPVTGIYLVGIVLTLIVLILG